MIPKAPYPFDFTETSEGGMYTGVMHLGPLSDLAANSVIADLYWRSANYTLIILGYGLELAIPVAPATPSYIHMGLRKYYACTQPSTGGVPETEFGARKRTVMLPMATVRSTMLDIRKYAAGSPIVPAVATREHPYVNVDAYGDKASIVRTGAIADLTLEQGSAVFVENGEGLELFMADPLLSTVSVSGHLVFRFAVVDNDKTLRPLFG